MLFTAISHPNMTCLGSAPIVKENGSSKPELSCANVPLAWYIFHAKSTTSLACGNPFVGLPLRFDLLRMPPSVVGVRSRESSKSANSEVLIFLSLIRTLWSVVCINFSKAQPPTPV